MASEIDDFTIDVDCIDGVCVDPGLFNTQTAWKPNRMSTSIGNPMPPTAVYPGSG